MIECKPPYPNKFHAGDLVKSKINKRFTDGTEHKNGDIIRIKEGCESYYNVHYDYYDLIESYDYKDIIY